ncbi:MAG: phosphatidate cytidylyltransferase [Gemmataceae bacterium]
MLKHRLLAGSVMAAAMAAVLVLDTRLAPAYPCLLACALVVGVIAAHELLGLLPAAVRPTALVCVPGVAAILATNWVAPVRMALGYSVDGLLPSPGGFAFVIAVAALFARELWRYGRDDGAAARVAAGVFVLAYLGYLPGLLVRVRWLGADPAAGAGLLALTIFTPKVGDIGAYTVGKLAGRTPFAPRLSPKKTWEGFVGGLAASVAVAAGYQAVAPVFRHGLPEAVAFGVVLGLAGVFGDLAESLLKRDAGTKDAAGRVPGFGGVLDVIDSVLFAGPIALAWFHFLPPAG